MFLIYKGMATHYGNRITEDSIVFHVDFANRRSFAPNILNYSNWTVGSGNVNADASRYGVTQYTANGTAAENVRVAGADPFGYASSVVWKGFSLESSANGEGGWDTGNFAIDNGKMYRFTVWTKRDGMTVGPTNSGAFYHGHYARTSTGALTFSVSKTDGSLTNNPYFHVTNNPNTSTTASVSPPNLGGIDVWAMIVGHVWPVGASVQATMPGTSVNGLALNGNHPDSGVWVVSGKIGNLNGVDRSWYNAAAIAQHRSYLYYSSDSTATQSFIYPRVDIVDGLEPTISELLAGPEPIRDMSTNRNVLYPLSTTDFDKDGRGLNFRGGNENILRGTMSATFSAHSVGVWFSTTNTMGANIPGMNVVQFGPTSSANNMIIAIGEYTGAGTNEVVSVFTDLTSVGGTQNMTYFASSTFAFQAGVWYNLVLSWSETKYLIYINGVEVATLTGGGGFGNRHAALYTNVTMAHIGSAATTSGGVFYPYGSNFNGKIGSVLVYGRSLTPSEVLDDFNSMKQKYGII